MFRKTVLTVVAALALAAPAARAQDAAAAAETRAQIAEAMGGVPTFITQIADAALPGLWQHYLMLVVSEDTALDPKTKALISLGVAAQIPCQYCVWMDTNAAREAGATDQEIAEAVAIAANARSWSTQFYGLQVDFDTFKQELGGH